MVSWAAPGGGVGPHFDSYDVFLVQAAGRRVWRLQRARRWRLVEGAPLKLIEGFAADEEILAEPGDLLYLPPGWGHDGVALDDCVTCSVGLRAPQGEELAAAFLDFLHERGLPRAALPRPRPAARAAQRRDTAAHGASTPRARSARIRWSRGDVGALPRPLPHHAEAARRLQRRRRGRWRARRSPRRKTRWCSIRKTQLLTRGKYAYCNGEEYAARARPRGAGRPAPRACARGAGRFTLRVVPLGVPAPGARALERRQRRRPSTCSSTARRTSSRPSTACSPRRAANCASSTRTSRRCASTRRSASSSCASSSPPAARAASTSRCTTLSTSPGSARA